MTSAIILLVVISLGSYFLGNLNWAIIISKLNNKDIRKMGSGNPGTLNMSRNFGLKLGLLTFFLDIMKGVVPVIVAFFVFRTYGNFPNTTFPIMFFAIYLCGLFAVLGHIYPVIFKFKGGKGIATTIGVLLSSQAVQGWSWVIIAVMALVAAVVFIYLTEFGAMGSFIAITPTAISASIFLFLNFASQNKYTIAVYLVTNMLIFAICFFTWFAHRKNIERMLAGDEHPTSIKEMVIKLKMKKTEEKNKQENSQNQELSKK